MAFNFPSAPSPNQIFVFGDTTYQWNGYAWLIVSDSNIVVPKVQIKRTITPNSPPGILSPGELAIEMANPLRLWVGVPQTIDPSGRRQLTPSDNAVVVSDTAPFTPKQGTLWFESDSMILWLYYDDGNSQQWLQVNGGGGGGGGGGNAVIISDTAPPLGTQGDLFWESDTGLLWIWYDDGTSAQWVQAAGSGGGAGGATNAYTKAESDAKYVKLTGDKMTGTLQMGYALATLPSAIVASHVTLNWIGLNSYFNTAGSATFAKDAGYAGSIAHTLNTSGNYEIYLTDAPVAAGAMIDLTVPKFSLTPLGNINVKGSVSFTGDTNFFAGKLGTTSKALHFASGYAWEFTAAQDLRWLVGGSTSLLFLQASTLSIHAAGEAFKPGGGPWGASSDVRIKNVDGDYTHGLAEINQLQPVRYTYKTNVGMTAEAEPMFHNVAGKEFIGLVAQSVETVMPEMVTQSSAFIDGVEVNDLRNLDTGPLIFALVNAVKELSARIAVLEGTR